jgi:hypothetical protein
MVSLRAFSPALTYVIAFALFLVALCASIALVDRIGLKSMARNTASVVVFLAFIAGAFVVVTGDPTVFKALGPSAAQFVDTLRALTARFFS